MATGPSALAVAATIGELSRAESLPGPADFETLMPPVQRAWVRRVRGFNLWVLYAFDDDHVTAISLAGMPPVPIDG